MKITKKELIGFYAVGLLLFAFPLTRGLFYIFSPLSLLLVILVVFLEHKKWNPKTVIWFSFVLTLTFLIEVIGVKTGIIFGSYQYDSGLGPKIAGTPLIIGVNWLFLLYATHDIVSRKTKNSMLIIIFAALLMVGYDLIIELAALPMNLWHFKSFYPPLQNFIAWFVISIIFVDGFEFFKIKTNNQTARWLYFAQICFLGIIALYSFIFLR